MKLILESWRQYLKEKKEKIDVVDNTLYVVDIGDGVGPRRFAIVETKENGIVPFYQSSGKSTKDKAQGHWHIFLGFKPYKGTDLVGITLLKTQETIDLINNEPDGELAKIAKALPTHRFTKLEQAKDSPERTEFKRRSGERIGYSEALFQSAIGNKWLYDAKALNPGTMARNIDPETDFIGFEEIPIGKLFRVAAEHKDLKLPARYDLAGSSTVDNDQSDSLTLYHRTSPEAAEEIVATNSWKSKEQNKVFFSTKKEGQAEGFGKSLVKIEIPEEFADLDDEFPDGEQHYSVTIEDLKKHTTAELVQ